jgi:PD-(D/E)XK nuclease superfamily
MPKDFVPPHFSYSSLSSYMQCGQRYFLEKIAHVPEIPSWWFVGGSAVHKVTELWDQENFPESGVDQLWQEVFNAEVESQQARFPDVFTWRTAGRKKAKPDGEDYLEWMDLGPKFVRNYIAWRSESALAVWDEAIVDVDQETGEYETAPAIELALDFEIGGWKSRGSIDRVFVLPDGELLVTDIKTGSRMPDNDLQLGMYAVGMEVQYGVRPRFGAFFNPRLNKLSTMWDLSNYTIDSVADMGVQFKRAIQNKIFLPHKSALCNYCSVNAGCAAFGGKDANLYTIKKVLNG